jgi:hypothetical protein
MNSRTHPNRDVVRELSFPKAQNGPMTEVRAQPAQPVGPVRNLGNLYQKGSGPESPTKAHP